MFRLHAILVDTFQKVRFSINEIVAGRDQRSRRYPSKNALFHILSLADQLHQSKSTNPAGPMCGKI